MISFARSSLVVFALSLFPSLGRTQEASSPAQVSAFADWQAAFGSSLLSLYEKKPTLSCNCIPKEYNFWVDPFGDWLTEKGRQGQIGFHTNTWGVAFGFDAEPLSGWTIGLGGAGQKSHIDWSGGYGYGHFHGFYGGLYTDYTAQDFFLGLSSLLGYDSFDVVRTIESEGVSAVSSFGAIDWMGKLSAAYFFGAPTCHLFPYGDLDLFYLRSHAFQEKEAGAWNADVQANGQWTFRSGAGIGFEVIDKNYDETICISPLIALGWAMQWPLERPSYAYTLEGGGSALQAKGWDKTWQLFVVRFGINFFLYSFTLSGGYTGEFDVSGGSPYKNQYCDVRLSWSW